MKRVWYVVTILLIGILLHVFCDYALSFFGVSPNILLLLILAQGFIQGPLMGEIVGFGWGMICDSMGISIFGQQIFLFSLIGYLAGTLRRRVATERPSAQVVVCLIATLFYAAASACLEHVFEGDVRRVVGPDILLAMGLNSLLVSAIFWGTEKWLKLWKFKSAHF